MKPKKASTAWNQKFKELQETHQKLVDRVEDFYISADTNEPEKGSDEKNSQGVSLEYKHILRLANNLKFNIRRRAVASFHEWSRLDQAVGGRNLALGAWAILLVLKSQM